MPPPRPPSAPPDHDRIRVRRMRVDTLLEHVVYMRADSPACRSEGLEAQARVLLRCGGRELIATLNVVLGDMLAPGEAGLSESAWRLLGAQDGDVAVVSHPPPVESLSFVRAKAFGRELAAHELAAIVRDVVDERYSDVELTAFIVACAGGRLGTPEITALTSAMIATGRRLDWASRVVLGKHCVGGLPGNRTTLVVVPIVAAAGGLIPKTSSRSITSPAGTADAMETLAPVDLDLAAMRRVVEREGACIAWGGRLGLSPADDIFIRVERPLEIDAVGQLVASILSKNAAAGSTDLLVDIPVGPTAKVRSTHAADALATLLVGVGAAVGLRVRALRTDGTQPIGRGMGPALEARDALAVLRGDEGAPKDLRARALLLAGAVLEMDPSIPAGTGLARATEALECGRALAKLEDICEAQGGRREPPSSAHRHPCESPAAGRVAAIDNRRLARAAKLAGAPTAPSAGAEIHVRIGDDVAPGQPLFTLHAETPGELAYARAYVGANPGIVAVESAP